MPLSLRQPPALPPSANLPLSAAGRLGERLIGFALQHRIALGVCFLAVCGWKLTLGLEYVLDLRLGDETKYLGLATGYTPGPLLPEWSPLYVWFYRLEHLFAADPVNLFFLHEKVVATLLPMALFVYLASRRVPYLAALGAAVYLLISVADLPVGPKTLHLAVAVMFLALSLFVRLGERPARWGMLVAACGVLSLIRPEFLVPLALVPLYPFWLGHAERRLDWHMAAAVAPGLAVVGGLFAVFGSPLFGGRSSFAFAQHFALNYAGWMHLHQDPWTTDFRAIYAATFGNAQSIPAAFLANPPAFLHHIATNAARAPVAVAGLLFSHFNLLLPRYEAFTLIEAGLLLAAVLGYLGYRLCTAPAAAWPAGLWAGAVRFARESQDRTCLLLFMVPFAAMMVVLYPRYHYALAFGASALALAVTAAAPYVREWELGRRSLLVLPVMLAVVPSIGSLGARVDTRLGDVELDPRPAMGTVEYLRTLHIGRPAVILEAQEPGVAAYLGPNFSEVGEEDKTGNFAEFVKARRISIVVVTDRMRGDARFAADPEWRKFEADPASFGFFEHALPDEHEAIYVANELLRPREAAAAPR